MNPLHRIVVLFSAVIISACAQAPGTDLAPRHERALAELAQLQRQPVVTDNTVQHSEQFYVPQLDLAVAAEPDWYSARAKISAQEMPVGRLLTTVFSDSAVATVFAEQELAELPVTLEFDGLRGELIKRLQALTGWHLQYDARQISWSRWQTAEFDVAFIAGATEFFMGNRDSERERQQQQNGMLQAPAQRSSEQYSNFRNEHLSVWDDLRRTLALLLSPAGQLSLNQSSTSVVVRDTPYHVSAVADYLQQQNERLTRQVAIEVQIIEVSFTDDDQLGIDWQALLQSAGGNAVLGLGSGGLGRLSEELAGQLMWRRTQGRSAGSELFIEALQQQGLVRINNQPRVLSLNNQIAKIALQDNATYLASAGTTSTVNVGATTTLQPGVVTTGFELYLLPSIRDGEVMLQLSTELSDLQRIDEVRSGEQLIQTPHTNRKQFFMQAVVGDGQTLLLSGLRNEREQWQEQQSWISFLFGGQQRQQQQRSETLVLLTPTIIRREIRG
ncbi:hypothetical protein [Pseudidiomarina insulisalsae]|uniref:Type II/III secretion system secretin-like domain-containing protein n=1 Tax=Pseudidiomarina insulisalsae TaxID=575789 RepID=A0A432YM65_9GAMM|nr:hypothetical protein [Pseudidiomarina insulisalsae]RUO61935.1 hypothetical protein CWI71_06160 [Pseudidiomarina insulisalsae]